MIIHFDNIRNVRIFGFLASIAFVMPFVVYWLAVHGGPPVWWFRPALAVWIVALLGYIYLINPTYVLLISERKKFTISYHQLMPFPFLRQSKGVVEVPVDDFRHYEIVNHNYGLSPQLVIVVGHQNRLMQYKPISLSLCDAVTKRLIQKILNTYLEKEE